MRRLTATLTIAAAFTAFGSPLVGQQEKPLHESAGALEEGGAAYRQACAYCHGPDGDLVAGIDLGRGQFRRNLTDADLTGIIRKGIPGTPMPPTQLSEEQAARIVAYLRSMAASKTSAPVARDTAGGRAVYDRAACGTCHQIAGAGSRIGPDLSSIGLSRRATEIERSILDPQSEVQPNNRLYRVVTRTGEVVTGRLLNQDTFTVQMLDQAERLRSFDRTSLREHGFMETTMPSYRGKLSPEELADLVAYLASMRRR